MADDYIHRKQDEQRQRFDLIRQYLEEGRPISVADRRFYDFYRICVMKRSGNENV